MEPYDKTEEHADKLAALAAQFPMPLLTLAEQLRINTDTEDGINILSACHATAAVRWAALVLSEAQAEAAAKTRVEDGSLMAEIKAATGEGSPEGNPSLLSLKQLQAYRGDAPVDILRLDPETGREVEMFSVAIGQARQLLLDASRYRLARRQTPATVGSASWDEPIPHDAEDKADVTVSGPDAEALATAFRAGGLSVKITPHGEWPQPEDAETVAAALYEETIVDYARDLPGTTSPEAARARALSRGEWSQRPEEVADRLHDELEDRLDPK